MLNRQILTQKDRSVCLKPLCKRRADRPKRQASGQGRPLGDQALRRSQLRPPVQPLGWGPAHHLGGRLGQASPVPGAVTLHALLCCVGHLSPLASPVVASPKRRFPSHLGAPSTGRVSGKLPATNTVAPVGNRDTGSPAAQGERATGSSGLSPHQLSLLQPEPAPQSRGHTMGSSGSLPGPQAPLWHLPA